MPLYLFIPLFLNSMDAPNPLKHKPLTMNHWEFFSEINDLDRIGPAIPFWQSAQDCSFQTLTHLHILDHSNLSIKDRSIFDAECKQGETSYLLAQKGANKVLGHSKKKENIVAAQEKFEHENLTYSLYFYMDRFDLIVSCHSIASESILTQLKVLLNPQGEIFCLFKTQSNEDTIEEKALSAAKLIYLNSNFESAKKPTNELLKEIIAQAGFEILAYDQKKGDILILPHEHQKMIAGCKSFFKSLPVVSFYDTDPTKTKKYDKFANAFAKKFVELLTKDDKGNWFYPYDYTAIHIKKTD